MSQDTLTKEQILRELEKLPAPVLLQVLELARTLATQALPSQESDLEAKIWQAYLESEAQRQEVYRRLAIS